MAPAGAITQRPGTRGNRGPPSGRGRRGWLVRVHRRGRRGPRRQRRGHRRGRIDGRIHGPGETFNAWWSNTGSGPARREYHASIGLAPGDADDDEVIYYHDFPAEIRAEALTRGSPDQSITPLDEPWPLLAWPDVPTRVLAARHDRMFPLDFQRRIARQRLGVEVVDEIDGGHMVAMSNPAELAGRLEAYRIEVRDRPRDSKPKRTRPDGQFSS